MRCGASDAAVVDRRLAISPGVGLQSHFLNLNFFFFFFLLFLALNLVFHIFFLFCYQFEAKTPVTSPSDDRKRRRWSRRAVLQVPTGPGRALPENYKKKIKLIFLIIF